MSKSIKLANNIFFDSSGVVHNKELLSNVLNNIIKFKTFNITFDVSNISVGEWVGGHTENNVPLITGMQIVGFLVYYVGYGDANFVLVPQWRGNKIYTKMLLGYKGNETKLSLKGFIIYANQSIVDYTELT